jgi:hypothetical protein
MITVTPAYIAIGPNRTKTFVASGGTAPYAYVVLPGGPGGTIDPISGIYTPPQGVNGVDTIQATDSLAAIGTATVLVGTALHLVADIIQTYMGLANGRAWVYDEKIKEPTDTGLFVVVGVLTDKIMGTRRAYEDNGAGGLNEVMSTTVSMMATIDIKSRNTSARDRRHEIAMALASTYSQQQQHANGFKVGPLPAAGPQDLSQLDGSAVIHWYQHQTRINFSIKKVGAVGVFTNFQNPTVTLNQ